MNSCDSTASPQVQDIMRLGTELEQIKVVLQEIRELLVQQRVPPRAKRVVADSAPGITFSGESPVSDKSE